MRSRFFLLVPAVFLMGTNLALAQSYNSQGTSTVQPGQAPVTAPSGQVQTYTASPDVGIVTLKPGQTFATSTPQDYGSVRAGATSFGNGGGGPGTTAPGGN